MFRKQLMATSSTTPTDPLTLSLRLRPEPRRVLLALAGVGALVAVGANVGSPLDTVSAAIDRTAAADPWLVLIGVLAEFGSFAGYVALTCFVVGREVPRVTPAVSAQITLAGTAVNRLLPTGGLGGIGLTIWALRRAGLSTARATSTLLTFLVLLYAVFLAALALAGLGALVGGAGDAPAWTGYGPALFGTFAIGVGAALGLLGPERIAAFRTAGADARATGADRVVAGGGASASTDDQPAGRSLRLATRARSGAVSLAGSVRGAAALVRTHDPRLAGALAWWGFDLAVLAAAFAALGDAPAAGVIALGYFAGIVANTVPIPGAVTGGMTGVLLLCGVPADLALPAVLAYRGISLWIPVPLGAAALVGLRHSVQGWAGEDASPAPAD